MVNLTSTTYHIGGLISDAPAQNRAEELNGITGTYTRWDESGQVVETRPLTPSEIADVTEQVDPMDAVAGMAPSDDAVQSAVSDLEKALDPNQANPTTAARLTALEVIVARLVAVNYLITGAVSS